MQVSQLLFELEDFPCREPTDWEHVILKMRNQNMYCNRKQAIVVMYRQILRTWIERNKWNW